MLPTQARQLPSPAERWAFEVKHDGFRALLFCEPERVRVQSRNLRQMTMFYPELQELARIVGGRHAVLDGELVAYDEQGRPCFESMQKRAGMHEDEGLFLRLRRRRPSQLRVPVAYQIFDLLYLDGQSVCHLPYRERRERLLSLGLHGPHWLTPSNHEGPGADELLQATRDAGLEGLVAKRLDSPYLPGERSDYWYKIKNWCRQEFVVGGWREDREEGAGGWLGALLLGYYENGQLLYAGGVEVGFTVEAVEALAEILPTLTRAECPFVGRTSKRRAHYLDPLLVVEVQFIGWSTKGSIKHAAFKGFVLDRPPAAVRREQT